MLHISDIYEYVLFFLISFDISGNHNINIFLHIDVKMFQSISYLHTDMEDTKKLLVDAANFSYPLSIILVGLTSKDKEKRRNMNLLDGDTKALSYRNQKAKRDIVQFVGKFLFLMKATDYNLVLKE